MIGCQTSLRGLVACQPCACKKLVHVDRVRFFHEAGRPDTLAPYLRHRPVPPLHTVICAHRRSAEGKVGLPHRAWRASSLCMMASPAAARTSIKPTPMGDSGATSDFVVGIVGGGVAGTMAAVRLAHCGVRSVLVERSPQLVSGPPFCHVHAGGNMYREISDEQCLRLLRQSVHSARALPHCMNNRPTVISVPVTDPGSPQDIIPRLHKVRDAYAALVKEDPANEVFGPPSQYFRLFSRAEFEALARRPLPTRAVTQEDWVVPVARNVDTSKLKFPVALVEECGWSLMRAAATLSLAIERSPLVSLRLNTECTRVQRCRGQAGWVLHARSAKRGVEAVRVDFLVNAAGFQTGVLDDWAGLPRERMVEYKSAFLARWRDGLGDWPEVIFHGQRGTPAGMAQVTPYGNGLFQLHGMTRDITLHQGGLVKSGHGSSQPPVPPQFMRRIMHGWSHADTFDRTSRAVRFVAQHMPRFATAVVGAKPLHGAQQLAGRDKTNRVATAHIERGQRYARVEIVKVSSALAAADRIVDHLHRELGVPLRKCASPTMASTARLTLDEVVARAVLIARSRGYPDELARVSGRASSCGAPKSQPLHVVVPSVAMHATSAPLRSKL